MIARHIEGAAQAAFNREVVRELRSRGMRRADLATRLGITRPTLCGYLTPIAHTPLHVVLGVCLELELQVTAYVPDLARLVQPGGCHHG